MASPGTTFLRVLGWKNLARSFVDEEELDDGSETEAEDDVPPAFPLSNTQRASAPAPANDISIRTRSAIQYTSCILLITTSVGHSPKTPKPPKKVALAPGFGLLDWAKLKSSGEDLLVSFKPVVYSDAANRRNPAAFAKLNLWYSDLSYEKQPPSITSLKVITGPKCGEDTVWTSGYALYSSLSPGFQKYLEGPTALHSAVLQADGARAKGLPVRREPVENVHPIVRVHPVTGWKSVYVGKGFIRCIIEVPKAESDAILQFLWRQLSENPDFQVVTHTATFDFWPQTRHALRVTPYVEKPESAADNERRTGKTAKDYRTELWKKRGIEPP
ncbi:hypothetical protein EDD16DRAFT_1895277 [Pisolithus croceorrhizus]|nr:hypothetical protein EDD16DRAFT_1895277 [Pisolithus croceorrhizus]KAI6123290.1 hypothetical protein EV401DRAFT_2069586 [Pisolithus croceorrhizus]KAI6167978.1 hypothetical protein EDD17DRAFT_1869480 [Pisolithus thermaeus]